MMKQMQNNKGGLKKMLSGIDPKDLKNFKMQTALGDKTDTEYIKSLFYNRY